MSTHNCALWQRSKFLRAPAQIIGSRIGNTRYRSSVNLSPGAISPCLLLKCRHMIVRCNAGQAEASLDTAEAEASLDSAEDGASLLTKAEAEAIALKGAEAESRLEAARVRERLDAAKEKILEDTRNIELYNDEILTAKFIPLEPIKRIQGTVTLPGSKSLSNRVLLLAALSQGLTCIENILDSEDTQHMVAALTQLGVEIQTDWEAKEMVVHGCGGRFPNQGVDLFLGNAGTAMRPLTAAVAAAGRGKFVLDGVPRMRERPIQDLVDGLVGLGVDVKCTMGTGCPPVEINATGIQPGKITLSGRVSSQFLTAVLMAVPLAEGEGATDIISEGLISQPYVEMTIKLMERFGVQVEEVDGLNHLRVPAGQRYKTPGKTFVEGDASSASYWLAGAALTNSNIKVEGCGSESLQGDVQFADVMERMGAKVEWKQTSIRIKGPRRGALQGGDFDCRDIPDAAMTLAVVAAFANSITTIRNVGSWRVKETERMRAIVTELRKLGVETHETEDSLTIIPLSASRVAALAADTRREESTVVAFDTYDDHRMAMAFALAACAPMAIIINEPGCVRKTYPYFFSVLHQVSVQEDDKKK